MPLSPVFRNVFQVRVLRQRNRRRLGAPSRHTWEAIGTVAHHGQVVWNRLRLHSEFGHNAGFITQDVAPAVELNHSRTHNTLTEIFVWRTNEHLLYTVIPRCVS